MYNKKQPNQENFTTMCFRMRPIITCLILLLLAGCASFSQSELFRDRNLDYTREKIVNHPVPVTPAGLDTPGFAPKLQVPDTSLVYPPESPPDMTPPGFHEIIPVPALPALAHKK